MSWRSRSMSHARPGTRMKRRLYHLVSVVLLVGGAVANAADAWGGDVTDGTAIDLPEPRRTGEVSVEQALAIRRSVRSFEAKPLPLVAVAQLLWAAQGVSHVRGLRTAPSAGALYPLEIHLVVGAVEGLAPGVYRYDPTRHRVTPTQTGDRRAEIARVALAQAWIAEAPLVLAIAAVPARTARKYGERSERYVAMEVGHAAQNVYLQAVALGLGTTMVGAFHDDRVARVLDLPAGERPMGLMPIGRPR